MSAKTAVPSFIYGRPVWPDEFLNREADEANVLKDLVEAGFGQRLRELYQEYQEGEISLGYLAEQLGVTTWRAYHLLEERGLRTANV